MTVITFDTLKYTKILMEAGVPQRQAEGQATALSATGPFELFLLALQSPNQHDHGIPY